MEQKNAAKFDAMTVMFMVYLMYEANILTRHRLKDMINIIKNTPEDIDFVKKIVAEAEKAT